MSYKLPGVGYRISGEEIKRYKATARKLRMPLEEYIAERAQGNLRCDGGMDGDPHWAHKSKFKQNWSGRSRTCNECKKKKSTQ